MKAIYNKDQRLESHRFFPVIAWIVVLTFTYFVFTLISDLRATAAELGDLNKKTHDISTMQVKDIQDFSR